MARALRGIGVSARQNVPDLPRRNAGVGLARRLLTFTPVLLDHQQGCEELSCIR
jgi:hypothetical protein